MSNPILDALAYAGETLDKPGAALRGLLAGRPDQLLNLVPFSDTAGWTNPEERTTGRQLLEALGALQPKGEGEGFGWGDVAGIGTEMALDPLNLVGGAIAKKLIGVRRAAEANNAKRVMMLEKGAMPEEIAALTKAVDETGNPVRTYHGTANVFDKYDMTKMDREALYGLGIYTTSDPIIASEYASARGEPLRADIAWAERRMQRLAADNPAAWASSPDKAALYAESNAGAIASLQQALEALPKPLENVRAHYVDIRNPLNMDARYSNADAIAALGQEVASQFMYPKQSPRGQAIYDMMNKAGHEPQQMVRGAGFDSIMHTGGINGGPPHQVYVAFDPSQLYAPWIAPREMPVSSMSPLIAAMLGENALARGARR